MADLVVLLHFLFVLFVVCGGILAIWWPRIIWAHLPAAVWGVLIEFGGWICPLTPIENRLRLAQGKDAYEGDFIAHYILPVLYPEGLTRSHQLVLGGLALSINLVVYALVFSRHRRSAAKDI
jgi:hypothetical protein